MVYCSSRLRYEYVAQVEAMKRRYMYVGSFFKKETVIKLSWRKDKTWKTRRRGGGEGAMGMDGRDGLFLIKVQVRWW